MRYSDIVLMLSESYENDLKRVLRDALVVLKTSGVKEVNTQQILDDFDARGMKIDSAELINLLQNDPLIQNANDETITFTQDNPDDGDENSHPIENQLQDIDTVGDMAKKALGKRLK